MPANGRWDLIRRLKVKLENFILDTESKDDKMFLLPITLSSL